jgi:hypothetical protein
MTITSLDDYIAAVKQNLTYYKSASRTTVAAIPFTIFDLAGNPGAGTLAIGNTANGVVPTDTVAGYPILAALSNTGYFSGIDFSCTIACRITLFDRLFAAGAYAFNADVSLSAQPSYAGRVPQAMYSGLQLWVEAVTAFTGNPSFQINYLDQAGSAGDTGVVGSGAALTVGRCFMMPLAAGDNGIQQITRVRGSVATAGTFNVMVLRPLWTGRIPLANGGDVHDMLRTGLPIIYQDSALYPIIYADGTASGSIYLNIEVVDG